jgi:hypothetical protein
MMSACGGSGACRWATVEVWLHAPEVAVGDVPCITTDRQVCLRCGAARLVRALDGRVVLGTPPPLARVTA